MHSFVFCAPSIYNKGEFCLAATVQRGTTLKRTSSSYGTIQTATLCFSSSVTFLQHPSAKILCCSARSSLLPLHHLKSLLHIFPSSAVLFKGTPSVFSEYIRGLVRLLFRFFLFSALFPSLPAHFFRKTPFFFLHFAFLTDNRIQNGAP